MSAKQGQTTEIESGGTFLFLKKQTNNENTHVLIYFMGAEYVPSVEISIPPDAAYKKMPAPKRNIYDGHLRFKVSIDLLTCDKYRVLDDIQPGDYGILNYSYSPQSFSSRDGQISWLQTSFHSFSKVSNALTNGSTPKQ